MKGSSSIDKPSGSVSECDDPTDLMEHQSFSLVLLLISVFVSFSSFDNDLQAQTLLTGHQLLGSVLLFLKGTEVVKVQTGHEENKKSTPLLLHSKYQNLLK